MFCSDPKTCYAMRFRDPTRNRTTLDRTALDGNDIRSKRRLIETAFDQNDTWSKRHLIEIIVH